MEIHDETAYQSEQDLRGHKPEPVNALIQYRAYDSNRRVENSRKKQRSHEARCQDWIFRKHLQHRPVEKAHKQRGNPVNHQRREQAAQMKLTEERIARSSPADKSACSQKVHGVPHAVIAKKAIKRSGNSHGDASRDAAFDSSDNPEGFNGKNLAALGAGRGAPVHGTLGRYGDLFKNDGDLFMHLFG